MDIIPVLDLSRGIAVRAQAGDRSRYEPVESALTPGVVGDPVALLRAYQDVVGATECYLADLDAIQGAALQRALLRELTQLEGGFGGRLMVDAGIHRPSGTQEVLACGASEVVVGLETLHAFADLAAIVELVGPSRVVFSLDLRLGNPLMHPSLQDALGALPDPVSLAAQAIDAGVCKLLVLDIGRVGTGCGVDLGLLAVLRQRLPSVRLLAGGGVLTLRDLERMRSEGCDGALLASALHNGRIGPAELTALAQPPDGRQSASRDSR